MTQNDPENEPKMTTAGWTKIAASVLGAILVGLQGVNLNELGQVSEQGKQRAEALKGISASLANQTKILEGLEVSIKQNSSILENGSKMLDHDSKSLDNQQRIMELLEKNMEVRQKEKP
jgi:uncharacterized protein HemX